MCLTSKPPFLQTLIILLTTSFRPELENDVMCDDTLSLVTLDTCREIGNVGENAVVCGSPPFFSAGRTTKYQLQVNPRRNLRQISVGQKVTTK